MKEKIAIFFGANYPSEGLAGVARIQDMFKYITKYEKHLISPRKGKLLNDKFFERIYIVGQHRSGLSVRSILHNTHFVIRAIHSFLRNNKKSKYKVIYAASPPFFSVLAAVICGKLTKTPVIADVRDPWATGLVLQGFTSKSLVCKIASILERFGYNSTTRIIVVTNELGKILERGYGVPKEKITVIPNAADIEVFKPRQLRSRMITGLPEKSIVLMYQGSFAVYHNISGLVKVFFEYLERSGREDVFLVLVGKKSRVESESVMEKYAPLRHHLILVGEVPREEVPYYISAAHIGIVPIKRSIYSQYAIPLKLYEYAACGKPILLFGGTQESENLIKKHEIGAISTGNVKTFQTAVETLLKRYEIFSENAIKMSKEINRENSAKSLEGIIDELVK
ncbi:hypothetical protein ES706_01031 [subsurface metagenome]|nr:glycosyltransferase [Hadesarchaea archaeon]